ncbi:centrosome-associated protein [Salix suchowensis]|nr:centrosome-associated protein [Salix suchowensis]
MFRLHKHKSDKFGDTLDFKFSSFQALQVPKGWDRLFVYIISVETGKTLSKSGKGSVRNGSCRWTESMTESIPVSEKQIDDCLFKFVVSMGSSRSGILGEATVSLGSYKNAETAVPVSLPLKKCNHGTILLVRIQCLTPRAKPREEQFEESGSYAEDVIAVDYSDTENKSDVSDSSIARSVGSSSSNHLIVDLELGLSASGSRYSFDSMEGSLDYSLQNNLIGTSNHVGRQDSTGSHNSSYGAPRSHLQNQRESPNQLPRTVASSPLRNVDSSKDLLEAAEVTIEELRAEARMWEQNARRLMIDLEKMQKDLSDRSMHCASLEMELSESHRECDGSRQKIEQLKIMLEESEAEQKTTEKLKFQAKGMENFQKEIEDELKFQKERNSNIELVSILQELEDTIETQKIEISDLSKIQSKGQKAGKYHLEVQDSEETQPMKKSFAKDTREASCNSGMEGSTVEHKLDGLPVGSESEDSRSLELDLQNLQDSQKNLESTIHLPERSLEDKIHAIEVEQNCSELTEENLELLLKLKESEKYGASTSPSSNECLGNRSLFTSESEVRKLRSQICKLEEEMSKKEIISQQLSTDHLQIQCADLGKRCADLELQLEASKDKTVYLDFELSKYHARGERQEIEIATLQGQLEHYKGMETGVNVHPADILQTQAFRITIAGAHPIMFSQYLFNQKEKAKSILSSFVQLKDLFEAKSALFKNEVCQSEEVRAMMTDLEKELLEKISGMEKLNSLNEQEIDALRHSQMELETQISNLQNERWQLEQNLEVTLSESMVTSKCLDDLRKEITKLSSDRDSHASAKEILERKLSELESGKLELEAHLSELEKENVQYLTNDRESTSEELHNSESSNMSLREEIKRLESELEAQKVDARQKMQDMQERWLEAQEECRYLKVANPKLQITAESLIEECSVLQKSNAELRKQKMQLHEHCTILEAELRDSEKYFANVSKEVEALEGKYILLQQEIASKEQALGIELDSLLQENKEYKEKLAMEENLLNQMHLEKTVEVENLQRDIAHLTEQISATHGEKERTASEAVIELSHLRSGRAMLVASLQELQGKLELSESNLCTLQMESEIKVLGLMQELAASKQNQEVLMADHEKLLELLEDVKSNEEKHKSSVKGLEIKLKASEYARQQVAEETSSLKIQLQKTSLLQDEILDLKRLLNEAKFENQKLEASSQICPRGEALRLEGDLTAREAIGAQDAELKNELARAKRANSEFQRKIRYLEEEKQECLKKAQALEEKLEQGKTSKQDQHDSSDASFPSGPESRLYSSSKIQLLENELAEALEANDMYKAQLKRGDGCEGKISSLQTELKDLQERYFDMSLKYAEVEAERAKLVLKLKTVSNGRRWFS